MYSEDEREKLLDSIAEFIKNSEKFICLLQIGSGAEGYRDVYSDIDLMAGCAEALSVKTANDGLAEFFIESGAVYIDYRRWTDSVLGISAYFENGLSVDFSFMPLSEMPIRSKHWKLLWSENEEIKAVLERKTKELDENVCPVNQKFHHSFFYALRRAETEILRENYICADMAIGEARRLLLIAKAAAEGKELHQFKAYNTLSGDFLEKLKDTYTRELAASELIAAKDKLLSLYISVIENSGFCEIDDSQFRIINCFKK